jgi:hypothetical protein
VKRDLEGIFLNSGTKGCWLQLGCGHDGLVQAQVDAGNLFVTGGSSTAMTEAKLLTALQGLYAQACGPLAPHDSSG